MISCFDLVYVEEISPPAVLQFLSFKLPTLVKFATNTSLRKLNMLWCFWTPELAKF